MADRIVELHDDRLSPNTYIKLRKLGYKNEQWRGKTQEWANSIIKSHEQNRISKPPVSIDRSKYTRISELRDINKLRRSQPAKITPYLQEYVTNALDINRRYRNGESTKEDLQLISEIQKNMIRIDRDIILYRTNKEETFNPENGFYKNPLLSCTTRNDMVIPENRGKVKEKIGMFVDKGTYCAIPNNADEVEIILDGQNLDIDVIKQYEKDGIVYKVLHIKNKQRG